MKLRLYILLFFAFHFSLFAAHAQDEYNKAVGQYEIGNFEAVDSLLRDNVAKLNMEDRVQAYRLLALTALNLDRLVEAEGYVAKLLSYDPFYTAYNADPRFTAMIERLKKGRATITTASWQEETLEEAPVPMTLITEDMLRASGARTLEDVLLLYVPGMSRIGGLEDNVAMRGVSGMTQETILVMENGNRLNSHSTNAQPMDYRINLDKVKQIEVLRGPASSLYGNVALTAVVNVITKTGAEIDGGEVSLKAGNFYSFGGTFLYGKGNLHSDISAWLSVYNSKGQGLMSEGTKHYVGGYNSVPSYDLGINARWGDFKLSVTGKHAKPVPFCNLVELGNFSYDKFSESQGEKPGMSRTNLRFDASYSHKWNDFYFSASAFGSYERMQLYNAVTDNTSGDYASMLLYIVTGEMAVADSVGLFERINWADYCMGGNLSAAYNYGIKNTRMKGSVLAGLQYECFIQTFAEFALGSYFDRINGVNPNVFESGNEHTISAFAQLKHHFTDKLIFNGGLRYDHRIQFNNNKLNKISPRASLIWLANKNMSFKAGYSHSFVDAPFLYRASTISLFGGTKLRPESMNAYQIGGNFNWKSLLGDNDNLSYECNLFYNEVRDFVFYDLAGAGTFTNAGHVNMGGIEQALQYTSPRLLASLNITYQYPFKIEDFAEYSAHEQCNVPKFIGNLVASWKFLSRKRIGDFWVRANLHTQSAYHNSAVRIEEVLLPAIQLLNYTSQFYAGKITDEQYAALVEKIEPYQLQYDRQPFQAILGAGLEWRSPWRFTLAFDANNICNTKYYVGGLTRGANPQQGFSFLGTVKYRF